MKSLVVSILAAAAITTSLSSPANAVLTDRETGVNLPLNAPYQGRDVVLTPPKKPISTSPVKTTVTDRDIVLQKAAQAKAEAAAAAKAKAEAAAKLRAEATAKAKAKKEAATKARAELAAKKAAEKENAAKAKATAAAEAAAKRALAEKNAKSAAAEKALGAARNTLAESDRNLSKAEKDFAAAKEHLNDVRKLATVRDGPDAKKAIDVAQQDAYRKELVLRDARIAYESAKDGAQAAEKKYSETVNPTAGSTSTASGTPGTVPTPTTQSGIAPVKTGPDILVDADSKKDAQRREVEARTAANRANAE